MSGEKDVYVVDDSNIIASMITQSVNELNGLKAQAFKSAEEMLRTAEVAHPDLVILDYFLDTRFKGGFNGGDAARHLREFYPKTKIILISGTNNKKAIDEIKSLDVDAKLHKDSDDILDLINAKIIEFLGLKE